MRRRIGSAYRLLGTGPSRGRHVLPAGLDADTIGPVDVAVILFEGNKFNGDVAPALSENLAR